jgi:tagatose 6-phosphate kinase
MDRATGHATELVEESKLVEAEAWDKLKSKVGQHAPRAKLMVLSGSLPPEAPQDFYAWCAGLGVRTIVDAAGEPLRRALEARPFLVKPNRAELAKTLGISLDFDDALRDAVKRLSADWAVITEGKSGAIVSNGSDFWHASPPGVQAINPIGSGDSLAAGIATALVRGEPMPDAVKLGIACGAANAMTKTAGVVDANVVAQLQTGVTLTRW